MEKETQSHLEGEAQATDTLENPADNVSGDGGSDESSSDAVHPDDGQSSGDENGEVFHEEGGRKFKTKDEFIAFYRQQRGAASRVARENKELKTRLEQIEAANARVGNGQQSSTPAPSQDQIEKVDEEVARAAEVLAKTGKFVSPEQLKEMKDQLALIQQYSDQMKIAAAHQTINSFLESNPDAVGHEEEMADLIKEYGLDRKGTEEGLRLAYRMYFGKDPKAMNPTQVARQAYKKGQENGLRKSQAGAAPGSNAGGSPASTGGFSLDFSLLDT